MPEIPSYFENISIIVDTPCWIKPVGYWEKLFKPAIEETLRQAQWDHPVEFTILLTDPKRIQTFNKTYRGIDKPTNVLSFPSLESHELSELFQTKMIAEPVILGDIALSYDTIQNESVTQGKPFEDHLIHLVVHGILHLLGFDHETDEEAVKMETLETNILSLLTIPNPY